MSFLLRTALPAPPSVSSPPHRRQCHHRARPRRAWHAAIGNRSRDRRYRRVAFLAAPEKAVSQTLRKDEQAAFNNRKSTGKKIIRFQQVSTGPDCVSGVLVRFVIQYLCGSVQCCSCKIHPLPVPSQLPQAHGKESCTASRLTILHRTPQKHVDSRTQRFRAKGPAHRPLPDSVPALCTGFSCNGRHLHPVHLHPSNAPHVHPHVATAVPRPHKAGPTSTGSAHCVQSLPMAKQHDRNRLNPHLSSQELPGVLAVPVLGVRGRPSPTLHHPRSWRCMCNWHRVTAIQPAMAQHLNDHLCNSVGPGANNTDHWYAGVQPWMAGGWALLQPPHHSVWSILYIYQPRPSLPGACRNTGVSGPREGSFTNTTER